MFTAIHVAEQVRRELGEVEVYGREIGLDERAAAAPPDTAAWNEIHARWRGRSKADVADDPRIRAYSEFYRSIGLDPKKTPPSVQNLLQRFFIKDELARLPLIHPAVDAVNLAALEHRIPLGAFDSGAVVGSLRLDFTQGGEPFQGLGEPEAAELPAGVLVLADGEKVLSRFCYRDGEAQKVTAATRSVWLLGCQVPGIPRAEVEAALDAAAARLERTGVRTAG
ncbi:hypothetical protein HGI30_05280 [Paenibacillus albicereus]|uniref:B3/B4 tRNA-binding domain-containing protein n=1 Tax=Paenibacillus albicereus TaxID=2726185 RepID=A0A6H2GUG5_9BACL|nr:phenylalanine--tRNA ligase beta subunit-related protein [Paenibacillus albicereus]QJC51032.1 hypothetical protein HGI30_05280 [Paenibacillus albicereus]